MMKRFFFDILLGVMVLVLIGSGCSGQKKGKFTEEEMEAIPLARRTGLPAPTGGMVLAVNTETVEAGEIVSQLGEDVARAAKQMEYDRFARLIRPVVERAVMGKVTDLLVYEKAKLKAPEGIDQALDEAVEKEISKFVAGFDGNYGEAQKTIAQMGYTWDTYRDYQRRYLLTSAYVAEEMASERPITQAELLERYYDMKEEHFSWDSKVHFYLIDLITSKLEDSYIEDGETREAARLRLANSIMDRLRDEQDFGGLAKAYSHGHRASRGGDWGEVTVGSLAEPYSVLEQQALKMEPGEIFGPIEAGDHMFILKLEDKRVEGYESFDDVKDRIEAQIRMEERREKFDKMMGELIKSAKISDMEQFVDFCVRRAYETFRRGTGE